MRKIVKYQWLSILLFVAAVSFQSAQKGLILLEYAVNTEAFAAFCINKDQPDLHCDGKCQLTKDLNEDPNQDTPIQNVQVKLVEIVLFYSDAFRFTPLEITEPEPRYPVQHPSFYVHEPGLELLKPPTPIV